MRFTRNDFYDCIFQPYNDAVRRNEYVKIDYSIWRKLRDWSLESQWLGYEIRIDPIDIGYNIYPYHNEKITPEVVTICRTSKQDFARYIEDHQIQIQIYDRNRSDSVVSNYLNTIDYQTGYAISGSSNDCQASIQFSSDAIYIDGKTIPQYLADIGINVKEKENNNMKFNFDFGPVDSSVRMSLYGMAIKNASGTYVAYDAKSKQVMDVDIFNFEGANKFIYKMPAAFKDIAVGDVVIHARKPMFVMEKRDENRLNVLDIYDGEEKTIVLTKSPFNFDFITKVVSLVDFNGAANAANPFGNMLPLLMLSDNKTAGDRDTMLMYMLMNGNTNFASNPLMLYALMGKDKDSDLLPLLLMCGSSVLPTGCTCNCADGKNA